ncbi:MAG TPA: MerC domain-containing protein [Puia sp.]|nr:MerC domain-containing protein [Puia sp.]
MYYREQTQIAETKTNYRSVWDKIGISASLVCAVHCVLLPVFFSTLPFLGIEILENKTIEIIVIATSLVVGSWALFNGYRHYHKGWFLVIFVFGIIVLVISNTMITRRSWEIVLKAIAAVSIVTAHLYNWKFSKRSIINH